MSMKNPLLVLSLALAGCTGGSDPGTGSDGGASSSTSSSSSSSGSSTSSGGASSSSGGGGDAGGGCQGMLTVLVKNGQSSSCGHDVPVAYDAGAINVYFSGSPGVLQKVCRRAGSGSCGPDGKGEGWFWAGDKIAFCDATCAKIDEGPNATFLIETGCPTTDCK